ncbi:MAP_0585 family protein [Mycobacterium intermedium]|nr:MAP_0585 family protein [Mycobacterium intermedium]
MVLNPPSIQPPHPPYVPRVALVLPGVEIGGPIDTPAGFSIAARVPPPPPRAWGWNDGPAPGHPPPNWQGPPPNGSWDGPPPPGGWNRPWSGAPRDVNYARNDFGPFNYNTFTVVPVFNWQYGGWGYWFFGVWVPLY